MPFAEHFMVSGVTLAAQTATLPASININCGFPPTHIEITNQTQFGQTGTGNLNIQTILWDSAYPTQTNVTYINAAGTALLPGAVTTNGISLYSGSGQGTLGALQSGTVITKANPAVVTATAHGLQTGQTILMTNNAVMTQLGGTAFTVTVTNANTFTIPINTNTANFTQETSFKFRAVTVGSLFYPQHRTIDAITAANPMVVSTTEAHGYQVGQQIRLNVPSIFGMTQANNIQSVITAVTSTTFTLGNVNSSAFTAFAYPGPIATAGAFSQARAIPIGASPTAVTAGLLTYYDDLLVDSTLNQQFNGFIIGSGLLVTSSSSVIGVTASDVLTWTAWRGDV
jgi:hypothetical protein